MKKLLYLSFIFIFVLACNTLQEIPSNTASATPNNNSQPKNIILLIGDGMGITQITAGLYTNGNKLNLERFKNIGLHKPYSGNKLITDSAAAATSFACGVKTYNGAIGVNLKKQPVTSILELAERNNKATGLVATSTIVHATPAAFIAHQEQRKMYEEIAADFLKTDIDVFIGGGKKYFDRRESDERNLYDELKNKGYLVKDYFDTNLAYIKAKPNQKIAFLTADDDPIPVLQGRKYLNKAAELSIKQLSMNSEEGFFLMVEGSQIDWGGHANNSDYIVSELLEFDGMVGTVLDWAMKDKNTLVIVTADHETFGRV